jgi:hypothetical protein
MAEVLMNAKRALCNLSVSGVIFTAGMWSSSAQEIFTQGGTQGLGIGAALSIGSAFGIHADFNAITFRHDFKSGGIRYQDDVHLRQGGIYGDFFPWRGRGFRLTAGVRFNDNSLIGTSVPTNGTYTFKGKVYPAFSGEYATAEIRYPLVMPYLGIGFGHVPLARGFGVVADLGVAYGIPKVTYTLSPALTRRAGPQMSQDIANTGRQELQSKASPYRWYPVLQLGISYKF